MKLVDYYKKLYNTCSNCRYRNVEFPNDPCWSCIHNVYGNREDEEKTDNFAKDITIIGKKDNNGK